MEVIASPCFPYLEPRDPNPMSISKKYSEHGLHEKNPEDDKLDDKKGQGNKACR
jgi:hypothetical protein